MKLKNLVLLFLLCIISNLTHAQCAMCKAAVESNLDSGGLKGAGLNVDAIFSNVNIRDSILLQ